MLRTISAKTLHPTQDQLLSSANRKGIKNRKRSYLSRRNLIEEKNTNLEQPKVNYSNRHLNLLNIRARTQGTTPLPNFSPPLFVNIEQSKQVFSKATWNRMNLITPLLMSFQARGIGNFVRHSGAGNFNTAVHALLQANRVLLCTGFNVAENMPETDGPLGTALLAYACFRADKYVVLVADQHNARLVRTQLSVLDAACLKNVVIEEVRASSQAPSGLWENVLDRHQPDAVVHTEVPGRNKDGKYLNMRGIEISDFNAALDSIADLANARGLNTISVGDGGNEAGMGNIKGIPKALNGEEMQAVIPAAHQVIAWNSNLGAIAMGEFIMSAAGKGPSCDEKQFAKLLEALFLKGAVDGVTRGKNIDEKVENSASPGHYGFTCVDGARSAVHLGNLLQVQDIAHNVPLIFPANTSKKNTL